MAHWLLKKENPWHERIFRALARVQVLLLFVIMVSALQRMRLYQREYGIIALEIINPDALIVRTNVAHARAGRSFDADFVAMAADRGLAAVELVACECGNSICVPTLFQ
jgi:hypothetical protein